MKNQRLLLTVLLFAFAIIGFLLLRINSIENPQVVGQEGVVNVWGIFLLGLFTGGLTCLAVQGGLLTATIAQREEEKLKEKTKQSGNALPIIAFLGAKLVAYTLFGFLLGWFGSLFQLSITAQIVMQIAVAVFMLGTALSILNVHPIFRYFIIQPPKFVTRMVRNKSKSKSLFAPVLLGAFTVFIPCGTTQAMMALAMGSGNPLIGSAVLFSFVLGTSPLFFVLGYFATKLSESLHKMFMRITAGVLILLSLFNLNNVLALTGNTWTFDSVFNQSLLNAPQDVTQKDVVIEIEEEGYAPQVVTVNKGEKISFHIKNDGVYTCAAAFTIPAFNYQKFIPGGKTETIELTMPDKPTQIPFMCSMGMYRGVINVL